MGNCTRFFSNAFEEFGLTEIYALITTPSEDHYGFRIYKNNDCTGNPFGFRVEIPSMEVRVCKKLELPFVGNQADFTFERQCADCDKLADLRGKYGDTGERGGEDEPMLVVESPNISHWAHPRRNGLMIKANTEACAFLNLQGVNSVVRTTTIPMDEPPYVWNSSSSVELINEGQYVEIVDHAWCDSKSVLVYHVPLSVLTVD